MNEIHLELLDLDVEEIEERVELAAAAAPSNWDIPQPVGCTVGPGVPVC